MPTATTAGLQVAQQAMGHANLATTELYLSKPTLDEIATRCGTFASRRGRANARSRFRRFGPQTQ
jgi:hypothetical protein